MVTRYDVISRRRSSHFWVKVHVFSIFFQFFSTIKVNLAHVTGPPAVPPPIKYTSSCREDQRLCSEGKIVSKYCNILKTLGAGRGSIHPPCSTVGVLICMYVRGLTWIKRFSLFYRINNYLSDNSTVQQHLWLNRNSRGSVGVWQTSSRMEIPGGWGSKAKLPSVGGRRVIFSGTTQLKGI